VYVQSKLSGWDKKTPLCRIILGQRGGIRRAQEVWLRLLVLRLPLPPHGGRLTGDLLKLPAEMRGFAVAYLLRYLHNGYIGVISYKVFRFFNSQPVYPGMKIHIFFLINKV
jgi:hypothetical protein